MRRPGDVVRKVAWNDTGMSPNPRAAFPRFARERDMGTPPKRALGFSYEAVNYSGQGSSQAIVCAKVVDRTIIQEMAW
jgi:hypothetical protein